MAVRIGRHAAITGLLAPTAAFRGELLDSAFPAANDPAVAVDVYRGDLGTDSGRGQSIFSIDQKMVQDGKLTKVARQNLKQGEQLTLDDGTVIRFDGVRDWVSLQVSHDPTQVWVLVFSVLVILGLGVSLSIKRRRVWVRATPGDDGKGRSGSSAAPPGLSGRCSGARGPRRARPEARCRDADRCVRTPR